ncbi:MAG: hypothetical protein ACI39F_07845 [Acutalibacteraceae bacterium]
MNDYIIAFIPKGKENAISQRNLALVSGLSKRQVKYCVEKLRQRGKPICSGDCGYWIGNRADINKTLKRLYSQVKCMQCTIKGLEFALSEVEE